MEIYLWKSSSLGAEDAQRYTGRYLAISCLTDILQSWYLLEQAKCRVGKSCIQLSISNQSQLGISISCYSAKWGIYFADGSSIAKMCASPTSNGTVKGGAVWWKLYSPAKSSVRIGEPGHPGFELARWVVEIDKLGLVAYSDPTQTLATQVPASAARSRYDWELWALSQ